MFDMGNAGTLTGQLRTAIRTRSLSLALNIAGELDHVDLAAAVALTALAAEKGDPRFEPMALRVIVRLIEERRLTLNDALWAAQRLQDCREGVDGETGLLNLERQRPERRRA
jgi:hypothetical protein